MRLKVERLRVYPVKSCGGIDLVSAIIDERGFRFDRSWIVVNAEGRMLTQREHPGLALIHPELTPESLIIRAASISELVIPLVPRGDEFLEVSVWGRLCGGIVESPQANEWLSLVLGQAVRLVRYDSQCISMIDSVWAGATGAHTGFADVLPFHIASVQSLEALNRARRDKGLLPTQMERFRPNIVLSGGSAWAEDVWPALGTESGIKLEIVRATTRCTISETDQVIGQYERAHGNNATLADLGRRLVGRDGRSGIVFGVQALASKGVGLEIRVGDPIDVIERSPESPQLPILATRACVPSVGVNPWGPQPRRSRG